MPKNYKEKMNNHSAFLDPRLKSDITDIISLSKYNDPALGMYLQSAPPVSHISNS